MTTTDGEECSRSLALSKKHIPCFGFTFFSRGIHSLSECFFCRDLSVRPRSSYFHPCGGDRAAKGPRRGPRRIPVATTMMRRPPSPLTSFLLQRRRGINSVLFPLLLLAAFASSLLATLSVTRTLTSWSLERKVAAVKASTRWKSAPIDGLSATTTPGAAGPLGSHVALFDDDDDDDADYKEEEEGEEEEDPPPPAGACAPMEHTE